MQCRQQARQQDQFDVVGKTEFLDWEAVQRVRVSAEKALGSVKTKASKLKLTRDVTVLRLLADQPPDRVHWSITSFVTSFVTSKVLVMHYQASNGALLAVRACNGLSNPTC